MAKTAKTRKPATKAPAKARSGGRPGAPSKRPTPTRTKPAGKAGTKSRAPATSKAAGKPSGKSASKTAKTAKKPVAKAPSAKPVAKKPTSKVATKPVGKLAAKPQPKAAALAKPAAKGAKPVVVPPAGKNGKPVKGVPPVAPAKAGKAALPASKATTKAASGKAAPAPTKAPPPPKRKGPIDLSTAKSVAAVAVTTPADASGYVIVNGRRVRMISTRGLPSPKRTKVTVEKEAEKPEPQISTIKTKLNKKELDEYRQLLLAKRRQLVGMLSGMEDEALRSNGGNLSTMPLHMADIGTDTFDQDFTLGMAETERALLDEIDAALKRIDNRTYGVCQLTGKPIPKTRLEAKPWAKHTVESAKLFERGFVPR